MPSGKAGLAATPRSSAARRISTAQRSLLWVLRRHGSLVAEVGTAQPDIYIPLIMFDRLQQGAPRLPMINSFWLSLMARLHPDATMQRASAEAELLYHQAASEPTRGLPSDHPLVEYFRRMHVTLAPGDKGVGDVRTQFRQTARGPDGRSGAGVADRLRQSCRSAIGARHGAAEGNRRQAGARRRSAAV